jgi:hypothetical protein
MNPVNTNCVQCGNRIATILDGAGCGTCAVAFHFECVANRDICPKCGVNVREQQHSKAMEAIKKDSDREAAYQMTRRWMWPFIAFGAISGVLVSAFGVGVRNSNFISDLFGGALVWFLIWAIWARSKRRA